MSFESAPDNKQEVTEELKYETRRVADTIQSRLENLLGRLDSMSLKEFEHVNKIINSANAVFDEAASTEEWQQILRENAKIDNPESETNETESGTKKQETMNEDEVIEGIYDSIYGSKRKNSDAKLAFEYMIAKPLNDIDRNDPEALYGMAMKYIKIIRKSPHMLEAWEEELDKKENELKLELASSGYSEERRDLIKSQMVLDQQIRSGIETIKNLIG